MGILASLPVFRWFSEVQTELQRLRTNLDRTRAVLDRTRTDLDQTRAAFERDRAELDDTNRRLNLTGRELEQAREQSAVELRAAQADLEATRAHLEATRADLDAARADLDRLRNDGGTADLALREQIDTLGAQAARLAERIDGLGEHMPALASVRGDVERMTRRVDELSDRTSHFNKRTDALASQTAALAAMRSDIDAMTQRIAVVMGAGARVGAIERRIDALADESGMTATQRDELMGLLREIAANRSVTERGGAPGDDGSGKPPIVREWERLYDQPSGGWFIPGWMSELNRFTPSLVEEWLRTYRQDYPRNVNYAPVEMEVANFYYWFCRLTRPRRVLETGTNLGYSAALLAAGMRTYASDAVLYTIDILECPQLFRGTPVEPSIHFLHGSSLEVEIPDNEPFDLLVLDSDHTYGTIMREILRFEPHLRVGGHMLFHDSMYFDGVGLAVMELMKNPRFEVVSMPSPRTHLMGTRPPGISLVRKISDDAERHPLAFDESMADIEVHQDDYRHAHEPALIDLHYTPDGVPTRRPPKKKKSKDDKDDDED
jgi:predicted O-methyltransferase YrrM/predicted  nucleic acid-binding Zn-ribbon protein